MMNAAATFLTFGHLSSATTVNALPKMPTIIMRMVITAAKFSNGRPNLKIEYALIPGWSLARITMALLVNANANVSQKLWIFKCAFRYYYLWTIEPLTRDENELFICLFDGSSHESFIFDIMTSHHFTTINQKPFRFCGGEEAVDDDEKN